MGLSEHAKPLENFEANTYKQHEQIETKRPHEDRIVLLTDGIFAIALTLLVLGIQIPTTNDPKTFNDAINHILYNNTLYYTITFAVLISYWLSHRQLMSMVKRIDTTFVQINVVFLAFVAFFPVTTSLLNDSQFPVAIIIYTIVLSGCGYSSALLWLYAFGKHRLIADEVDVTTHIYGIINTTLHPTFFLLSLFLLLIPNFPPTHTFYSWLILPLIHIFYMHVIKPFRKSK